MTDLSLLANDDDRQKTMDFLADAYATNCIDKPELERREEIVLAPTVRRSELLKAVEGLGANLFPEPKERPKDALMLALLLIVLVCFFVIVLWA